MSGLVAIVSLFIHPGREEEFRHFEAAAARIIRRHGGRIERAITPRALPQGGPPPHEIHVAWFPGPAQFEAYRNDPDLAALGPLRAAAIARTEIVISDEAEPYA